MSKTSLENPANAVSSLESLVDSGVLSALRQTTLFVSKSESRCDVPSVPSASQASPERVRQWRPRCASGWALEGHLAQQQEDAGIWKLLSGLPDLPLTQPVTSNTFLNHAELQRRISNVTFLLRASRSPDAFKVLGTGPDTWRHRVNS